MQALAEEVGAALVSCVVECGGQFHRYIAVASLQPDQWTEYFRLAFGAQSEPEDGVVLGDLMFKDTGRHVQTEDGPAVCVRGAEVSMYLASAFGPGVTPQTIGREVSDGQVIFPAAAGSDRRVVQVQDAWRETEAGAGRPVELSYRLGTMAAMDGPAVCLSLQVQEDPDSRYGCYVTAFCVAPGTK